MTARFPAMALALGALGLSGCGAGEEPSDPQGPSTAEPPSTTTSRAASAERPLPRDQRAEPGGKPSPAPAGGRAGEAESPAAARNAARRRALAGAVRAYHSYLNAINDRDGATLCRLLPPRVERELRPPVERGSCAGSLGASIGYRDPRGYAVWKRTTLSGIVGSTVARDLRSARLTAEIVTEFADRPEPSIESDIAYLERGGGRWRLAQPTGALYRAIGRPELPPSVISPPGDG